MISIVYSCHKHNWNTIIHMLVGLSAYYDVSWQHILLGFKYRLTTGIHLRVTKHIKLMVHTTSFCYLILKLYTKYTWHW